MRIISFDLFLPMHIINAESYKAEQKLEKNGEMYNFEYDNKKYSITKEGDNFNLTEIGIIGNPEVSYTIKEEQMASEIAKNDSEEAK